MRALIVMSLLLALGPARLEASTSARFLEILISMHPDYSAYVGDVRVAGQRQHPFGLLSGLVRSGGTDPRDPRDAPRAGHRNDIIVYEDTFEATASPAWRRLLVDHEYFHARHLGLGADAPAVDFGDDSVNRHYYEALAWGYNLERLEQGRYPGLRPGKVNRARERYRYHRKALERWILRYHADAWAHYSRFLKPIMDARDAQVSFQ